MTAPAECNQARGFAQLIEGVDRLGEACPERAAAFRGAFDHACMHPPTDVFGDRDIGRFDALQQRSATERRDVVRRAVSALDHGRCALLGQAVRPVGPLDEECPPIPQGIFDGPSVRHLAQRMVEVPRRLLEVGMPVEFARRRGTDYRHVPAGNEHALHPVTEKYRLLQLVSVGSSGRGERLVEKSPRSEAQPGLQVRRLARAHPGSQTLRQLHSEANEVASFRKEEVDLVWRESPIRP
ncbi:MAG: hypothetical protein QME96_02300 [Myxococcota bacterium]|nr:hypothetical protein [Myxococcota bacterium]